MKKSIAFIDCFIETPAHNCFNQYVNYSNLPCSYHMVSKYGFSSLKQLKKVDAFIILGSASHVSEKLDWHKELIDFIIPKLENMTPVLGICFGHQLLADHYGCEIDYIDQSKNIIQEIRDTKISYNELGFKEGEILSLAYSHAQVVTKVSSEMETFAFSSLSQFEALKHKKYPLWSFQAHPEASEYFILNQLNHQSTMALNHGTRVLDNFVKMIKL